MVFIRSDLYLQNVFIYRIHSKNSGFQRKTTLILSCQKLVSRIPLSLNNKWITKKTAVVLSLTVMTTHTIYIENCTENNNSARTNFSNCSQCILFSFSVLFLSHVWQLCKPDFLEIFFVDSFLFIINVTHPEFICCTDFTPWSSSVYFVEISFAFSRERGYYSMRSSEEEQLFHTNS